MKISNVISIFSLFAALSYANPVSPTDPVDTTLITVREEAESKKCIKDYGTCNKDSKCCNKKCTWGLFTGYVCAPKGGMPGQAGAQLDEDAAGTTTSDAGPSVPVD
ncbi:hypothetical protein LTR70_001301 [Exophiala xenobiotica]|uniref:Uncharacterized protein n=1 Tax=Lithohypha guttulata TaxID=1690604 RepID=A0ABR0KMT8_9EURO|nr:hypothetical protein LTR24_000944 [Lithohypha guttulata]KAK5327980.1 hypothetical protein LTR70_001301 [Exophiala xenobiotica]